jgi:host factor-I protein
MAQRKLIRPDLAEVRDQLPVGMGRRKPSPQERTNAESYYYLKQMSQKTPMRVVLVDGEALDGWIEWYDRDCLKVNREGEPNLLVMKHQIKYMYKCETTRNGNGRSRNGKSSGSTNGKKRTRSG